MRIIVLAMIAACDGGVRPQVPASAPPRAVPDAPPAVTSAPVDAAPATLDSPPEDRYAKLTPAGRVMATADGSAVLLRIEDPDGARAAPNLAFEVRDRRDRIVNQAVVEKLDEDVSAATLAARIVTANKLISSKPFAAVAELPSTEVNKRRRFAGSGLIVELLGDTLVIKHDQRKVVERRIPRAWRGRTYHLASEDLDCSNPEFLSRVYAAPAGKLVVVNIAYRGTDTCWEPADQLHVVAW